MAARETDNRGGGDMPFLEHLEALRWHLVRAVIAVLVITIACFLSKDLIFDTLIFGPTKDGFLTYQFFCRLSEALSLGGALCIHGMEIKVVNLEMAGQFLIHLKTSMVLGLILSFPYVSWEMWRFVKPALYDKEIEYTNGVVFFSSLLFLIGILFGYYVLTPFAIHFFAGYEVTALVENTFSLSNYISFLTMFVLLSGIVFELPMVVYFLSKLGLVTPNLMRTYRRHAVVVILLIAALITPADIGTQLLVFVPVFVLYEISIFISARVSRKLEQDSD